MHKGFLVKYDEKGLNGDKISDFVSSKGFDEMVNERNQA